MRGLFFVGFVVAVVACGREGPIQKEKEEVYPLATEFYHWRTALALDSVARRVLDSFETERLHVKVFDVSWEQGQLATAARLEVGDTTDLPKLIPVIFLTNEVFRQLPAEQVAALAENLLALTDELLPKPYGELQLDCDWTGQTKDAYFELLHALQKLRPELTLTCTVRLHQYRDRQAQGIPPVQRATLMAYNTGYLKDWATENSILDTAIIKSYLAGQPPYPIDLDLAVAAYDWAAVYRYDKLAYLINEPSLVELADTARFRQLSERRYEVIRSTYLNGLYLYAGDLLRYEVVHPGTLTGQRDLLCRYVRRFPEQRCLVYRLGSRLWQPPH